MSKINSWVTRKKDRMTSVLTDLTFKRVIIDAIKSKLDGTGINKMILVFSLLDDKYSVMLLKDNYESMKLDIEKDDITKIKKLLISRIHSKYQALYDKEIKAIIIEIDLDIEDLRILTQDMKDNVEVFNYKMM